MVDNRTLLEWFDRLLQEEDLSIRKIQSEAFWRILHQQKRNPICVDTTALFVYNNAKAVSVMLVGEWSYWQKPVQMERVEGTSLFYCRMQFPPNCRLQYKIICDGEWITDPANNILSPEGFGVNSEFIMPKYEHPLVVPFQRIPRVPAGEIVSLECTSQHYGHRKYFVYVPADQSDGREYPVLIVHDGEEALRLGNFHRVLDQLIAEQIIPPVVALFIPPGYRNAEYTDEIRYSAFCFEELYPVMEHWAKQQGIPMSRRVVNRFVTGASLGGRLATLQVLLYPDLLGGCIAQSPSYWWRQGDVFRSPSLKHAAGKKFVLQTGTIADAQKLTRKMQQTLLGLGAEVVLFEYAQGHSWSNWRLNFADAVIAWIGKPTYREHVYQKQHIHHVGS